MQAIIQFDVLDDISSQIIQAIIYFNVCEDISLMLEPPYIFKQTRQ